MEKRPFQYEKVGIRKAQKLEHASGRLVAPRGHRQLLAGKWGACGWAVVQLDYEEEMGAELTAFLCVLKRVIGPARVHVDNKGNY